MADFEPLVNATSAHARLWAIPGVRRIGFGFKETGGEVLDQPALRVYVDAKRPADELAPDELIPPEIDGIPTDVVVDQVRLRECKVHIHAGGQIAVEEPSAYGAGTIGCVVRRDGVLYILSNAHVLTADGNATNDVIWAGEPGTSGDRVAVRSAAATIDGEMPVGGKWHRLDCGLAQLNAGVTFTNDPGGTAMKPEVRDLSSEALSPLPLHKTGRTTGPSTGTLAELSHQTGIAGEIVWELSVKPATGGEAYDETFTIAASEGPLPTFVNKFANEGVQATIVDEPQRRVRFAGRRCSSSGDSGSVWLDAGQRPVGLHFGGGHIEVAVEGQGKKLIPTGRAYACHISAVFGALTIDPANGIVVGTTTTAGDLLAVPVVEPERIAALARSERGRALVAAVERHEEEVRTLIHHRRRVTVAWHRAGGPAFVAAGLRSRAAMPPEVAGHQREALVREMLPVLQREGSLGLQEALQRHGELLVALAERCGTLEDVAAELEGEGSLAAR